MNESKVSVNGSRPGYLARLLDALELIAASHGRQLTITELAEGVGMPLSTASRQVALLADRGLVQRLASGAIVPGPRLVHMALGVTAQLHGAERYRDVVRALAAATEESVSAGLLIGDEIVLVARQESDHPLRMVARVGDVITPHTSAMGKATLAHLPAPRRLALLGAAVGTGRAAPVLEQLAPELAEVRRRGYATDEEVYAVGLRCRAAPVLDGDGHPVAAISIAGPTARYTIERAEASVAALLAEATKLSAARRP